MLKNDHISFNEDSMQPQHDINYQSLFNTVRRQEPICSMMSLDKHIYIFQFSEKFTTWQKSKSHICGF